MTLHRRSFLALTGSTAAAGALGFPSPAVVKAATPVKLTLPWLPVGTYTFVFAAKGKGFWKKHGLDVTIDRGFGSGRVCVPVDQGQYDFGLIDLAVMMTCVGRDLDLYAIAGVWPKSPIGIFARKDSGITKPKDLEGKTVGFNVGSGDFQLWPAFVKATGIDDSKVKKVTMSPPALMKALVEGQIQAEGNFYGSIAPSLWAQGQEITSILYEDYGVKGYSLVLSCKKSTAEKKSDLCEAFVNGLMEGLKFVYLNPEEGVRNHLELVKEFQGAVTNRKVIEYGQGIGTMLGMVPSFKNHGLGYMDPQLMKITANSVETYMGVKNLPPVDTMYTNKFVGEVKLTDAQWSEVSKRVEKYVPKKPS